MSRVNNPPAVVIVWRITEACDLGCHFCAYSRHLPKPRASADPQQVFAFGEVLGQYAKTYSRKVLVSWLGGEPLRWPPVFEIARAFKHNFGLRLSATTNGTALASASVRTHVAELFDELTLSIDGVGKAHDDVRDVPGLFERLRKHICQLRQLKPGLRLRVNTILMRHTIDGLPRLCEVLAEWGVAELTFNALGGRDRPEFFPEHSLQPEHIEWLRRELPTLRARMSARGLTILGSEQYLNRLMAFAAHSPVPIAHCSPGQHFLFIDEQGSVSPCSYTTSGYGLPLSDLRSAADLHQLPQLFAKRQREHLLAPCYDCPSTQVFGKFSPLLTQSPHER